MSSDREISNYLRKILDALSGTPSITSILQQIRDKVATETTQSNILSQLQSLVGTFGEAFITTDRSTLALSQGRRYAVHHVYPNIPDNTTVNMTFSNPAGSGVTYTIAVVTFTIAGDATLTTSKNPTISSQGTSLTAINQNIGAADSSTSNTGYGATFTVGSDTEVYVSPAGKLDRALGKSVQAPYKEIEQGNSMSLQVYNNSGKTYDIELEIVWDEEVNV